MDSCSHWWLPDPDNPLYEDCDGCGATRKVQEFCPVCHGRKWMPGIYYDDEGFERANRAACGHCAGSGYVPIPPRFL
jgi:RecJ-like exonuclease